VQTGEIVLPKNVMTKLKKKFFFKNHDHRIKCEYFVVASKKSLNSPALDSGTFKRRKRWSCRWRNPFLFFLSRILLNRLLNQSTDFSPRLLLSIFDNVLTKTASVHYIRPWPFIKHRGQRFRWSFDPTPLAAAHTPCDWKKKNNYAHTSCDNRYSIAVQRTILKIFYFFFFVWNSSILRIDI